VNFTPQIREAVQAAMLQVLNDELVSEKVSAKMGQVTGSDKREGHAPLDSAASHVVEPTGEFDPAGTTEVSIETAAGSSVAGLRNIHHEVTTTGAQRLMSMGRVVRILKGSVIWDPDSCVVKLPNRKPMEVQVVSDVPQLDQAQFEELKGRLRVLNRKVVASAAAAKDEKGDADSAHNAAIMGDAWSLIEEEEQHRRKGHIPYSRNCEACVKASARSKKHPKGSSGSGREYSVGELSVDVSGPHELSDGFSYGIVAHYKPRKLKGEHEEPQVQSAEMASTNQEKTSSSSVVSPS
jgi:hypothetical protein